MVFKGSLECLVGAFLFEKCVQEREQNYRHGLWCLQNLTYNLSLIIWTVMDENNAKLAVQEMAERRIEFASPDEHKEELTDLTPAEKARIFFRGIESRNEVGWIYMDSEHR